MRVAVTGGSGKLGRAVVADLVEHGHDVIVLDAATPRDERRQFTRIDLTDYGQVAEALSRIDDRHDGLDAVVHLAAIPGPGMAPNHVDVRQQRGRHVQRVRRGGRAGIRNVVWASSETVLGLPFDDAPAVRRRSTRSTRSAPETTYSLGKVLDEEMARHFCRWDPDLKMSGCASRT